MLFGITGSLGAGKGTVVSLLKERGFAHYSVSGYLREIIESRGETPNRAAYSALGDELRAADPAGPVATLYAVYQKDAPPHAIIESIHDVPEAEFLRTRGAIILAVDAPLAVRYERIQSRGSEKDDVTFDEFRVLADHEENGGGTHNIRAVIERADHQLTNAGTLDELKAQVDALLASLA